MRKKQGLYLASVFFCALVLSGCGTARIEVPTGQPKQGWAVVRTARTQIGVPYKWGGASPKEGFDCSGYLVWVFSRHGIALPRHTSGQAAAGRRVARKNLRSGDIVVFRPPAQKGGRHTGIYAGNGKFLHSPSSGSTVREEPLSGVWAKWFVEGRRVLP